MTDPSAPTLTAWESQLLDEVSTDELWRDTETLARWERVSGTPGEAAAVEYLRARLEAAGVETTRYEFDSLLGWPEAAELEVRAPRRERLSCIAHAYSPSTPADGLEGDLVYVGAGQDADYAAVDAAGRTALVEGMPSPAGVLRGLRHRVAGLVFIQEDRLHELCISPVWGTPTTRTGELLPDMPVVSVLRPDGERLKELAAAGGARVWLRTRTFWGWRPTPLLVGQLRGSSEPDQFVLFSGHHCSWYLGAMDNGSANATMLEVARALARHRDRLRRSVRFAFWPGHTQGRYSGSTWYFDTFWEDLHDNCVLHVNVDSTGARGASIYVALGMPETTDFAMAAIRDAIGVTAHPGRQSRAGDQSFWACGVPSIFMDLSEVPAELAVRRMVGGLPSGLPWWWHTRDDTIDKIDRDVLRRDTRVYLLATLRAASAPVLPFRYEAAARHVRETIERYQEAAGERFDLTPAISRARALEERLARVDRLVARAGEREDAAAIQRRLMEVDRELVLVDFTAAGPFDQDLAVPVPAVPLLEPACRLPALDPASNEARFLATELLRGRNKVCHHLRLALERADALVARLS